MVCSNCGKEIPEGASYCLECGEPVETPVVLQATKEEGKAAPRLAAEGPFFNLSGYVSSLRNDTSCFVALLGAVFTYLAPFMSWGWKRVLDTKQSGNLFDFGSKNADMTLGKRIFLLLAVVIMLNGIFMLVISARENIRPMRPHADNKFIWLIPLVIGVVALVLILTNEMYRMLHSGIQRQIDLARKLGSGDNIDGGRGLGPVFYIAGMILYAVSVWINLSRKKR